VKFLPLTSAGEWNCAGAVQRDKSIFATSVSDRRIFFAMIGSLVHQELDVGEVGIR
jgi:hypothetical protein